MIADVYRDACQYRIEPARGQGVVRACSSFTTDLEHLESRLHLFLGDLLDMVDDGYQTCGRGELPQEQLKHEEEQAATDDEEREAELGLDDLVRESRKEHEIPAPTPARPTIGRDTRAVLSQTLRDNEIPFTFLEDEGHYIVHADAGSFAVAAFPDHLIMLGTLPLPDSSDELRALLRLNGIGSLYRGITVSEEDEAVHITAVVEPHTLHCQYDPTPLLKNTLVQFMRIQAKACSKAAGDLEDSSATSDPDRFEVPTLEESLAELDGLIGLGPVKKQVHSVIAHLRVQQRRAELGRVSAKTSQHLVFTGPPGTGKTTVARLVGQIYRALGVLESGHLIPAARQDLVAEYIGQTAVKTNKLINRAMGGVLFIDEAYTLSPEDPDRDFGREAVDTLLARMEDDRDKFIVIVAGYPNEMRRFLHANPGLESRFPTSIAFPDYEPAELLQIVEHFAGQYDYALTPAALETAAEHVQREYATRTDRFGNARMVRNLIEAAIHRHAERLMADGTLDGDDDQIAVLDAADFVAAEGPGFRVNVRA